jgi:hypoxanthine-DNA glycosylase
MREKHPFEAFVPEFSEVLILGSFPGKESTQSTREDDWFYGANRNQFWKILGLVYNRKFENRSQKQELFKAARIAITDIIATCERNDNSNSDINLINKEYNIDVVSRIIINYPIKKILFTSQWVQKEFIKNFEVSEEIELVPLPAPSPIYRRLSLQDKAIEYKKQLPQL